MKKKYRNPFKLFGTIAVLVGSVLLVITLVLCSLSIMLSTRWIKTRAVVSAVDTLSDEVPISYNDLDGETVEADLYIISSYLMRQGKEITIYYDPNDTSEVVAVKSIAIPLAIFASLAAVFLAVGGSFLYKLLKVGQLGKRLKEGGLKEAAIIESFQLYGRLHIEHSYVITLMAFHEGSDKRYKSQPLILQKHTAQSFVGQEIDLYVSTNINEEEYYLDIDSLRPVQSESSSTKSIDFFADIDIASPTAIPTVHACDTDNTLDSHYTDDTDDTDEADDNDDSDVADKL